MAVVVVGVEKVSVRLFTHLKIIIIIIIITAAQFYCLLLCVCCVHWGIANKAEEKCIPIIFT